jgi:hypothetical protein
VEAGVSGFHAGCNQEVELIGVFHRRRAVGKHKNRGGPYLLLLRMWASSILRAAPYTETTTFAEKQRVWASFHGFFRGGSDHRAGASAIW